MEILDEDIFLPNHELYQGTGIPMVARKYFVAGLIAYIFVGFILWENGQIIEAIIMCFNPFFFLGIGKCILMEERWSTYLRIGEKHLYSYKKTKISKKIAYNQLILIEQKSKIVIKHKLLIVRLFDFNKELEIRLLKDNLNRPYVDLIDDLRLKGVLIKTLKR